MPTAIHDSVLSLIGETPMVRLSRLAGAAGAEILAKCEFLNPGGSVKDRIGVRMLLDAEAAGRIRPGDTLIEPTSGNTGIGLALTAAVRGYRLIITMPEKMSREKQLVLEALGAEIIRTPTEAAWDSPDSHIGVAKRLKEILPRSHILDQYSNPSNPLAHEEGTGAEIIRQCDGQLDAIVLTAGTGGTLAGVARAVKKAVPGCAVVGVDPEGSILAGPGPIHSYKVEGIGYDFIPDVLDRRLVDRWIKTNDRDAFRIARRLIREEGLLVGGSSGSAAWAALRVAAELGPGKRVVTILPDSVRNYMSKFLDEGWLRQHGFGEAPWEQQPIADLLDALGPRPVIAIDVRATLGEAVALFAKEGISQLPCLDHGRLAGILTEADVLQVLVAGRAQADNAVAEVMARNVTTVNAQSHAAELPRLFERGEVAVVVDDAARVQAILTKIDLINYLADRPARER